MMASICLFVALGSLLCRVQTVAETILHGWIEKLSVMMITGFIFQSHLIFSAAGKSLCRMRSGWNIAKNNLNFNV